jgi:hypothetical protein
LGNLARDCYSKPNQQDRDLVASFYKDDDDTDNLSINFQSQLKLTSRGMKVVIATTGLIESGDIQDEAPENRK